MTPCLYYSFHSPLQDILPPSFYLIYLIINYYFGLILSFVGGLVLPCLSLQDRRSETSCARDTHGKEATKVAFSGSPQVTGASVAKLIPKVVI